jgi:predicted nucleic acid-binding protein
MTQIVFLDTDVILDYLENRDVEVRDTVAQLLLLHKKGRVILATSIFNIAELIDKELEIHFFGWCINKRMSYDEVINRRNRDKELFKKVSKDNKNKVGDNIKKFIIDNDIRILYLCNEENNEKIHELIYERNLRSQDALIVTTAITNNATYFLSNDRDLTNEISDLLNTYNLRNKDQRKEFHDSVLEAI